MLTINAQIKSLIDLAVYRKEQIADNKPLFKTIDHNITNESNIDVIKLLTEYPAGTLSGESISQYSGRCGGVEIYFSYKKPFTTKEQKKEVDHRVSNLRYAQNKIREYMQRENKNKDQVTSYLQAKELMFILD